MGGFAAARAQLADALASLPIGCGAARGAIPVAAAAVVGWCRVAEGEWRLWCRVWCDGLVQRDGLVTGVTDGAER